MIRKVWDESLLESRKFGKGKTEIMHIEEWRRLIDMDILDEDGSFQDHRKLNLFGFVIVNPHRNYAKRGIK